ncbi:ATP-dependent RNA helicase DDX54-like isoform X2 [Daphnia pulex]|uniref:ATP-dependent RNA helicase DDX54-like isoform X2 n=1 Tax=Daphnia pulex TaxID=6669 RepID=UPI001EDED48B|nr:ATP-dependent RNA helicase DDX54-like isoform X2 [Daphnia pulex]
MPELQGFGDGGYQSEAELDTRALVQEQNRKKKKSGGFQSMGLSYNVYHGIMKCGYKIPTPIQRKCIPLIMEKKDVVAMARTGSGKTACFLIPLFERLQAHSTIGTRALIMSPTRELALQTLKFTRELGKFTGLKAATILGGDSMEAQFAAMHEIPDIIIATPGRFAHLCVEMELKLKEIEYVVFDEADRLFEMGFGEQLLEILNRLPELRQTLLFSATLPKLLVDFTKAGLTDPVLVRLDVDSKLPEALKLGFVFCPCESKASVLLHLLRNAVKSGELTLVFAATMHHVEYLHLLLDKAGISNTYIYSSLDQAARKIHAAKFQTKQTHVMITTDVAARGIDIPLLDNVINYNFPAKAKLFVHRVGRVARAGRSGCAYSLVALDELPALVDLHLFLGRPVKQIPQDGLGKDVDWDGFLGRVGQTVIDDGSSAMTLWHQESVELQNMIKVYTSAYKQYKRSCPPPSHESVKKAKEIKLELLGPHPVFVAESSELEGDRLNLLEQMKSYRPHHTIFEIGVTANSVKAKVMLEKRIKHQRIIIKQKNANMKQSETKPSDEPESSGVPQEEANEELVQEAFSTVIAQKKRTSRKPFDPNQSKKRRLQSQTTKDEENYINYNSKDHQTESGLALGCDFGRAAADAVLDLTGDDDQELRKQRSLLKWDRKKKKFIGEDDTKKRKIRTESGVWIPATYKTDRYERWKEKSKVDQNDPASEDSGDDEKVGNRNAPARFDGGYQRRGIPMGMNLEGRLGSLPKNHPAMVKAWAEVKQGGQRVRDEVKRPEQIEKARKLKEKARLRGNKEIRIKLQMKQKKPTLKTKQKKGGKRRR